MERQTPLALIIDDSPDEHARSLAKEISDLGRVTGTVISPNDVTRAVLAAADLVLVDYRLEHWPERDSLRDSISLQPIDGLALTGVLRRHALVAESMSPTAFAIVTSKYGELMEPLPADTRPHIVSRLNGLEWIFDRTLPHLSERVTELTEAVRCLPPQWSEDGTKELMALLAIPAVESEELRKDLLGDAMRCQPAVHAMSQWSHGLAFIRWILHRILPYPCFLIGAIQIAARLRADPATVVNWLADPKSGLRNVLKPCEYGGILCNFAGPRWWRIGVEDVLWGLTDGQSYDAAVVSKRVAERIGESLPPCEPAMDPLVCYDERLGPCRAFTSSSTGIRIWPDDWPSYADQPWVTKESAQESTLLRHIVIAEDLGALDE